jgi:TolB protein
MRLILGYVIGICALVAATFATPHFAAAQPGDGAPPNAEDILGNIEVVAQAASRPLPKLAVEPSLASAMEDVTLRSVMRRDLELSGEFDVLPDSSAPEGLYLEDSPVNVAAWKDKGAQAVVKVVGKPLDGGFAELRAEAYYIKFGEDPIFEKRFKVPAARLREEAHHVADLVIGALTGTNGGFASHLTFASGSGKLRRIFTIDADGHDAKAVSPPDRVALAPAYGPNDELYYAASVNKDEYKVFTKDAGPLPLNVKGSVYGLSWNKDYSKVAVAIGQEATINVFVGPDLQHLTKASSVGMTLRPAFTPTGLLAFAGEGKWGQQIFVEDKPISPGGLFASAPTFCRHPDGIRAVFAVGVGKETDLVATGERGGKLYRLTQNQGSNGYPSCSPDGRLVAFFSTRKSGEGPGLYVMRVDGGRAKRISTLLGDSLRWSDRVPGQAVELPVPKRVKKTEPEPTP